MWGKTRKIVLVKKDGRMVRKGGVGRKRGKRRRWMEGILEWRRLWREEERNREERRQGVGRREVKGGKGGHQKGGVKSGEKRRGLRRLEERLLAVRVDESRGSQR